MKSNILITSAGRRVELVEAFIHASTLSKVQAKVYCTDIHPELSPACQVADGAFKVPRVSDEGYVGALLKICEENNIGLIIPTIDTELTILAKIRRSFFEKGIEVVISDEELVSSCRDKRKTSALFDSLQIDQPAILDIENLSFPCFCKPYDGSCSIGAIPIFSAADLTKDIIENPRNMFMELVPKSFSEYTIDAYYSRDGSLKCLVPRKRLEVRAGEVSKGVTRKNFVYDYLFSKIQRVKGVRGCITFQLFVNEETESVKGLEINPRFGGGYPLAHNAGATFTDWLIKEYLENEEICFNDNWEPDLLMLRYDAKVLIRESR